MSLIGKIRAPAKINLALRVEGRRPDGYHLLRMLNAPIDLFDDVSLHAGGDRDQLSVRYSDLLQRRLTHAEREAIADSANNSCMRALEIFRQTFGVADRFRVELQKRIPSGGGLGGGSSDAAAVLLLLASKYLPGPESELRQGRLAALAVAIGADVPFFLQGKAAEVIGIGETIHPYPANPLAGRALRILVPPFGCSTPAVYSEYRRISPELPAGQAKEFKYPPAANWLNGAGLNSAFRGLLQNDLTPAAARVAPGLIPILDAVRGIEKIFGGLSGSGSVVFAFPEERPEFDRSALEQLSAAADRHRCELLTAHFL